MTGMTTIKTDNMSKKIPSTYYTVLDLLAEDERCRNDDRYLICRVWLTLYPTRFGKATINGEERLAVHLKNISEVFEAGDTITRIRRRLQNDLGLFPPTSWNIARSRRIKEEEWRENMRNNFNKEQSKAIMEIYLRVKGASKKNLKDIKNQVINIYNI